MFFVVRNAYKTGEEGMADQGSDKGGLGAVLGMVLGVLLVVGLIFFFAGNWGRPKPVPAKTGQLDIIFIYPSQTV